MRKSGFRRFIARFHLGWYAIENELPLTLSRCPEMEGAEINLNYSIVVIPKSHDG